MVKSKMTLWSSWTWGQKTIGGFFLPKFSIKKAMISCNVNAYREYFKYIFLEVYIKVILQLLKIYHRYIVKYTWVSCYFTQLVTINYFIFLPIFPYGFQ